MLSYSPEELLEIGKQTFSESKSISRTVRKRLFNLNIWSPKQCRLYQPLNFVKKAKARVNGAKCGLLNSRSVNKKEASISELITDQNLLFLILTETWWSSENDKSQVSRGLITPVGYDLLQTPRPSTSATCGGGVAVIFKDSLKARRIKFKLFTSFEYQITRLTSDREVIYVTAVYLPSGYGARTIPELQELLDHLLTLNGKHLVGGDFNIHVNENNSETRKLLQLFTSYNFVQNVVGSTHRDGNTLDLIFSSSNVTLCDLCFDTSVPSDHKSVIYTLSVRDPGFPTKLISGRKWSTISIESVQSDIKSGFDQFNPNSVEDSVSKYNKILEAVADKHAPSREKRVTVRPESPWFNADLLREKKQKRKLENKHISSNLVVDLEAYQKQRNLYNIKLTERKQEYYRNTIATSAKPSEKSKICNKLLNREKKVVLPTHDTAKELAERFINYFSDKIKTIRTDLENLPPQQDPIDSYTEFSGTPLLQFESVSTDFVESIIKKSPTKSCTLDPVPTWLLKQCTEELVPVLTTITNLSLACAEFSDTLKVAFVSPLIKKLTLDCEILKNYRPVSNLSFLSKLIERVVCTQLISHLKSNGLYEVFQSAYREFHSTETALLRVQNDLLLSVDESGGVILVLLDLSAAFDTIDHDKLLKLLSERFGIRGSALAWIKSYLSNRKQSVLINGERSEELELIYGVPQGSVLGPILFTLYTTPLGEICRKHQLTFHLYADDTQLYIAFKPSVTLSKEEAKSKIEACVSDIRAWMAINLLKLNDDKTELLVITSQKHVSEAQGIVLNVGGETVQPDPQDPPRNLGVIFDSTMCLKSHISKLCKALNYKIYSIGKIRRYLDQPSARTLVNSSITSKMDYCNSLLYGLDDKTLKPIQLCQNNAARVITRKRKHDHITPVLRELHWLPVRQRISYKTLLLTYKSRVGKGPKYLSDLLQTYVPGRPLRSQDQNLLKCPPKPRLNHYGGRAFVRAAPTLWNNLPPHLREMWKLQASDNDAIVKAIAKFKKGLKTHLFANYYE